MRGAELLERPALARERPQLELGGAERADLGACLAECLDRLAVAVRLGERLGPRELRLDPRPHVRGDAVLEVLVVDAEPFGEPGDRVGGRARLAALDLAHVLLREAVARELGLGQSRRDAQRAHAARHARGRAGRGRPVSGGRIAHPAVTQPATCLSVPRRGELDASSLGFMVK